MNCRNVRRQIEETEPGELLGVAVKAHLASCAACETISREQSNLQTIISSLGTVEAPGDFEFRLRARLAGEQRGQASPYVMRKFSFGLRAGALASVLLLLGAAFVFVTFKTRLSGTEGGRPVAINPKTAAPDSNVLNADLKPAVTPAVDPAQKNAEDNVAVTKPADREPQKHRSFRNSAVAIRANRPDGTLDQGQEPATVVRPLNESVDGYPTAAFPINASYQSLKVSVDDGRGASRTISLPTVSFGSQRSLSQSASPLMASARGVW
jgi:hypothetical protein